jgi:hypothetical protein
MSSFLISETQAAAGYDDWPLVLAGDAHAQHILGVQSHPPPLGVVVPTLDWY